MTPTLTGPAIWGQLQGAALGKGASINGAIPFPAGNAWNTDISAAPVAPASDTLIASIGATRGLHPDFGAGLWGGAPISIPYVVVGATSRSMFVADNGSSWYISGAPDERWNNSQLLTELGSVKGSDFEVVRMDGLVMP